MPLPGDLTTITLNGTLPNAQGTNLPGKISIAPTVTLTDTTGHVVIPTEPVIVLFSGGSFTVPGLATTDNAHIQQNGGWAYNITIVVGNQTITGTYLIPSTYGASVTFDELVPATTLPNITPYATLAGNNAFTGNQVFDGGVQIPGGAANGDVWTSDAHGNGSWQPAGSSGGVQVGGDIGGTNAVPLVIDTHLSAPLPLAQGGTGASSAAAALANLGAVASTICDIYGLGLCTVDRLTDSGYSSAQSPGDFVLFLVTPPKTVTISTLGIQVTVGGVTGSGTNGLALYTEGGALIDQTGDMTTAMSSVQFAEGSLGSSHTVVAGTNYYIGVLTHYSGAAPKFAATGTTSSSNIPPLNSHYTSIYKSGQASFPANFAPSGYTLNSGNYVAYAR